jgi:2-methylcitrate dehydratase
MSRIEIRIDPGWKDRAPGGFPCTIVLGTADGVERVVEVPFACGHARNKMSKEQVIEKFHQCVDGCLPPQRVSDIVSIVDVLDQLGSVRELAKLLA